MPPQKIKRDTTVSPELLKAIGVVSHGKDDFDSPIAERLPDDYPRSEIDERMPVPIHPWQFQKDPPIRGMGLSQAYQNLIRQVPALGTGNVSQISSGPTKGSMDMMTYSGLQPESYSNTTMGGGLDKRNREISINPGLMGGKDTLQHVMAHELLHSKGKPETTTSRLDQLYNIYRMQAGRPKDHYTGR